MDATMYIIYGINITKNPNIKHTHTIYHGNVIFCTVIDVSINPFTYIFIYI